MGPDQSAYRSELAGMLACITILHSLASQHNLSPNLTLQCDCETALNRTFILSASASLSDKSHDLISLRHQQLRARPIQWTYSHIKGHQNDTTLFQDLTRPSQLNVIVDQMAKQFLAQAIHLPRHSITSQHFWAIWLDNSRLINDVYTSHTTESTSHLRNNTG